MIFEMVLGLEFSVIVMQSDWMCSCCDLAQLAVCGSVFELSFDWPFVDYLPNTVPVKFFIGVSSVYNMLFSNRITRKFAF